MVKLSRGRHRPPVTGSANGRLVVGRSEEARRQFAVLVGAGRRPAGVDVVEDAEQRFEVRVRVASDVDDLVAVLLGADGATTLLRQRRNERRLLVDVLLL